MGLTYILYLDSENRYIAGVIGLVSDRVYKKQSTAEDANADTASLRSTFTEISYGGGLGRQ